MNTTQVYEQMGHTVFKHCIKWSEMLSIYCFVNFIFHVVENDFTLCRRIQNLVPNVTGGRQHFQVTVSRIAPAGANHATLTLSVNIAQEENRGGIL